MSIIFISDLHLGHDAQTTAGFSLWLGGLDRQSIQALYILGDFFDAWIGDDDDSDSAEAICQQLRDFSQDVDTFFMRGNRDFLIGERFSERTGVTLLGDSHVIDLNGEPVLLMHGDSLCTKDTEYMQFRAMVRDPAWQQQVLSLPLTQRRAMAADLRAKSQSLNAIKAEDITDVTPEEVVKVMQEHGVATLIHGHTHRPAVHELELSNGHAQRWVLGAWHEQGWMIAAEPAGLELKKFPL